MEECELCGRETNEIYTVDIDGVMLGVCAQCAKGKKIVKEPAARAINSKSSINAKNGSAKPMDKDAGELIDDYGKAIKTAREKMGLPLPVLAEMINEKESHLLRVEEQKTLPSATLIKKLEKTLGIKLIVESKEEPGFTHETKPGSASIGEFLNKKE